MATILKPANPQTRPISTMDEQRKRQQRGTGFTNISSVLRANQGAGQQMGQQIGQNISNQAESVRQGIQQGQSQFQAGKQQATQQAQSNIQAVGQYAQKQPNESDEQYQQRVAQASGDLSKLGQTMRETAYTGPMGIQNAEQLQARASNVGQLGQLAGTRGGQTELLRNIVAGRGGYTRGQSALDQILLGQNKEGQLSLQRARGNTSGLDQSTAGTLKTATQEAQGVKSGLEQQKQNIVKNLQSRAQELDESAKQRAADYNKNATRLQALLQGKNPETNLDFKPGENISDSDMALLNDLGSYGLNRDQSFYSKTPDQAKNILQQMVTGGANLQQKFKYAGDELGAAKNLSTLMSPVGDTSGINALDQRKFDTNIFSPQTAEAVQKQSEDIKNLDKQQFQKYNDMVADIKAHRAGQQYVNRNYGDTPIGAVEDTELKYGNESLQDYKDRMIGQLNPEEQQRALGFNTSGQVLEYIEDVMRKRRDAQMGQDKTLQQMALERLGKTFIPAQQRGVDISKTKKQV